MGQITIYCTEKQNGARSWGYRFEVATEQGKRRWIRKRGFKTKAEAQKASREAFMQYESAGTVVVPSELSFAEFSNIWLNSMVGNIKETTLNNYRKRLRLYVVPHIGKYPLRSIKKNAIRNLLKKLYESGLSYNTLTSIKGMLTNCFAFAVDEQYLIQSPADGKLTIPKNDNFDNERIVSASKPHVYIPKDKWEQIIERFPEGHPSHIPLMLGYKCGMRLGEVFALQWKNIDLDNNTILIESQVQWHKNERTNEDRNNPNKRNTTEESGFWYLSKPKYNSSRKITIDQDLSDLLRRKKKSQENAAKYYDDLYTYYKVDARGIISIGQGDTSNTLDLVNVRENGTFVSPRTMQHTSSIIHHKMEYPEFDFHSLRHTHATILAENGASPMYVQHRLGHKNISVTIGVYFHYTEHFDQTGNELLEEIFSET